MKVYNNFSDYKNDRVQSSASKAIVTIGTFDGVHLGHQAILKDMVNAAKEIDGETVVITFYPHPRQVLNIDSPNLRFINKKITKKY